MSTDKKSKNTIFVIDAHSFIHRAYHALPKLTANGREVGALYGFTRFLLSIIKKSPGYLAICFDTPTKTFRHRLYPAYKAKRPKVDHALIEQIKQTHEIVEKLKLPLLYKEGYEADDLLAFVAKKGVEKGLEVVLVTSDKDAYQLVSDKVSISHGLKEDLKDSSYVKERFGVAPEQITDFLAIAGDSTDNIPGIAGVGAKGASKLIAEFKTLEKIIEAAKKGDKINAKLAEKVNKDSAKALLSKKLVTLDSNIPLNTKIEDLVLKPIDDKGLSEVIEKYNFKSLMGMIKPQITQTFTETKPENWTEVLNAAETTKEFFIQTQSGLILIGTDEKKFALKIIDELSHTDKKKLSELIEKSSILKISYDLKETLASLRMQIPKGFIINCFDLKLACYLLNPSEAGYDFSAVTFKYMGKVINPQDAKSSLCAQNSFALKLKAKLEKELEKTKLKKLFYEIEIPVLSVLASMENAGIEIDIAELKKLERKLTEKINQLKSEINETAGKHINLNSTRQLGNLLFDKMKIPPVRKTKTGYSTDEHVLEELSAKYDIAKKILAYRQNTKLKSTYVDNLIKMTRESTSRIHTYFDQTKTATGRLSSLRPNLQNIPLTAEMRKIFKAKKGYKLISADYSQIDLRVLANETCDDNLMAAFRKNEDIHSKTAAEVFGVMPKLVTSEMRKTAKAINFGIVYGQTGIGLSKLLKIPTSEAKNYIEHYFRTYPKVKSWIDKTLKTARKKGLVKTISGRVRYFPDLNSENFHAQAASERAAINTTIQGSSADIIKIAMIEVYKLSKDYDANILLQIHDELILEVAQSQTKELASHIKEKMQNAVKLAIPLVVDIKAGDNWQDLKTV